MSRMARHQVRNTTELHIFNYNLKKMLTLCFYLLYYSVELGCVSGINLLT